jgi:iron complex transport system substrate-binding protein
MSKTQKIKLAALALLCIALSACGRPSAESENSTIDGLAKVVPMRIVTDDLGRRITVPTKISRAVSLAPSVTESIFAIGAGDRLVGDTTYCNYPAEAMAIQKVGDTLNPNMETIVALKPDVVFVSGASQLETFTNTLDRNGIVVYVMNPLDLDAVFHNLEQLGTILGTLDKSQNLIRELKDRETNVRTALGTFPYIDETQAEYEKRVASVKVFVQISKEPLFTIGRDTFLNGVLSRAGGHSVTNNVPSAFPKLSKETAFALQPEAIILSDSLDNQEPNEVFKNSPAVKNGRVYKINADILSRPGPRLVDALEQIAKDLHPEKFQ